MGHLEMRLDCPTELLKNLKVPSYPEFRECYPEDVVVG